MPLIALPSMLLQDRFAATVLGLCEEANAHGVRDRLMAPLLGLLCRRLYGVVAQVSRALRRLQAGRPPRRRRPGAARTVAPVIRPDSSRLRLRYGWAWMIRMAPRVAQYAPQMQVLLDEPEMQAALAASPSLRRALRPLCRGLAFPTPLAMVETSKRTMAARAGTGVIQPGYPATDEPANRDLAGGSGSVEAGATVTRGSSWFASDLAAAPGTASPAPISNDNPGPRDNARPNDRPGWDDNERRGSRDSPGVAPTVLRSFTR